MTFLLFQRYTTVAAVVIVIVVILLLLPLLLPAALTAALEALVLQPLNHKIFLREKPESPFPRAL